MSDRSRPKAAPEAGEDLMSSVHGSTDVPGLSRPNSLAGRMQREVLAVLRRHQAAGELPTSGRFVFYELEGAGVVRKSNQGESHRGSTGDPREQEVTDALFYLREHGIVPWSWIEDETRHLLKWVYADSIAEFVRDSVDFARINPWGSDPPLLLVESRSLGGVLRPMATEYLCSLAATNGQVGGFLHTVLGPFLLHGEDRVVLYLGDWDHQGHQIEANTRRVLERVTHREIDWTRLAITSEQITARGLTSVWKKDHRYRPALEHEAWECEALGQGTIQRLVREALDDLLPEPLADVRERERQEREQVAEALAELAGGGS
jgi:hypothetical protein